MLERFCVVCLHPPRQVFKEHRVVQLRPLGIIEQIQIIALARAKLRQRKLRLLIGLRSGDVDAVLRIELLKICGRYFNFIRTGACEERNDRRVFERFAVRKLPIEARGFDIAVPSEKAGLRFQDRGNC